jgi:hypothetical protein
MRNNPISQSGLFNPRVLLALALCSFGVFLGMFSLAATPSIEMTGPAARASRDSLVAKQHVPLSSLDCQAGQGCISWIARYDGPGHDFDLALAVVLSPDNTRLYITGYSPGSGTFNDYATAAYDAATGVQLWLARYDSPAHWFDNGKYLAISPDGTRLFVTGDSNADGSDSNYDFVTIAYNAATGEQIWIARYDFAAGQEEVSAIAVSPDGTRVYITGGSQVAETNWDYATVAYNAATGGQLWVARHDGTAFDFDVATGLVISADGSRVFVTGGSDSGIPGVLFLGQDFVTLAYDATTGLQLWMATYSPSLNGFDTAEAIALNPDGTRVFVAGQSDGTDINMSPDYAVVSYDASNGVQQWAARYNGVAQQGEQVSALTVSHDGARVFVTGASQGATTDNDYATVAFDAAIGSQLWVATYDGPAHGFDAGEAVAVSPDDATVYVTGASDGGTVSGLGMAPDSFVNNLDYATIAYDAATGAEKWSARFDGSVHGNEIATAMALSSDGNSLYVTGAGTENNFLDYLTVAYQVGAPLVGVVSRKTHGDAGTYDVDLPLTGAHGIECRSGGANNDYTLVLNFANPLTSVAGATVSSGTGSVSSSAIGSDAHQYIVNLTGVTNAQTITVTLTNVSDSAGDFSSAVSTSMGVLIGDTTANSSVNSSDISQTKAQSGTVANSSNFRIDVTVNGLINSSDISTVKSKSGTALP